MKIRGSSQRLNSIAMREPAIGTVLKYLKIPSATVRLGHPQEKEMIENMNLMRKVTKDSYKEISEKIKIDIDRETGTLIIRAPSSKDRKGKRPLGILVHMDIVWENLKIPLKSINPQLIRCDNIECIASDGTTSLGADDKAGMAAIWEVIRQLIKNKIPHAPIETIISPDEEEGCKSLINMDTTSLECRDVINIDNGKIFNIVYGCSSFVEASISISGLRGGHSGDAIHERISANAVSKEVLEALGDGVISLNPLFPKQPLISKNVYYSDLGNVLSNVIPPRASIAFSLRSYSYEEQKKELDRIKQELKRIESKYRAYGENKLRINLTYKEDYPPWNGSPDSHIANLAKQAAIDLGHPEVSVEPAHYSTQANHLILKKNQDGEHFSPIVIGPNIKDEHSTSERVEWESILECSQWLRKIVEMYSS